MHFHALIIIINILSLLSFIISTAHTLPSASIPDPNALERLLPTPPSMDRVQFLACYQIMIIRFQVSPYQFLSIYAARAN